MFQALLGYTCRITLLGLRLKNSKELKILNLWNSGYEKTSVRNLRRVVLGVLVRLGECVRW